MRATEILNHEHRVIEQVLSCVERMAQRAGGGERLEEVWAASAIRFLREYADRCHHGKEEEQLFPMMEERGFSPSSGPTAVMRAEHVEGRHHIASMEALIPGAARGERQALEEFSRHGLAYVFLLRSHIRKEDDCLFPMADHALAPDDERELMRRFERVETAEFGGGRKEELRRLADELAEHFGIEPHVAPEIGPAELST